MSSAPSSSPLAFQSTLPVRGATCAHPHVLGKGVISIHAPRAGSDSLSRSSPIPPRDFNPRSPCGERRLAIARGVKDTDISIHAPRAGSDRSLHNLLRVKGISIHAPRAGSDARGLSSSWAHPSFQSTLPVRGATHFLSVIDKGKIISIHAPRAGSDPTWSLITRDGEYFNPRSPCGERLSIVSSTTSGFGFQSTLPVRGATPAALVISCEIVFQSTLPVRGATSPSLVAKRSPIFQSTLPVRGATGAYYDSRPWNLISIHAPRAGSDLSLLTVSLLGRNFNPRSPCGERRTCASAESIAAYFNPRSPCGERPVRYLTSRSKSIISIHAPRAGSDPVEIVDSINGGISIHAPRAGSDTRMLTRTIPHTNFNPRSPCGERPTASRRCRKGRYFNPRSPCGERQFQARHTRPWRHFNPRSPCGERRRFDRAGIIDVGFQSTLPVRGATPLAAFLINYCLISIHAPRAGSDY